LEQGRKLNPDGFAAHVQDRDGASKKQHPVILKHTKFIRVDEIGDQIGLIHIRVTLLAEHLADLIFSQLSVLKHIFSYRLVLWPKNWAIFI